ncbi:MAG: flavoprotein [Candidatus Hydrogenedentota bacterium]
MNDSSRYDAIILGAGAAGLMCAMEAGKRGRRVLLVEHNDAVGKKIRISGGGRCNFTNVYTEPSRFVSQNPRFCHSALACYTPQDFADLVESHGIAYHEKKLGQLFCDGSAQQIIDALVRECREAQVEILTCCTVREVARGERYRITTSRGVMESSTLAVATGGLSIPKLGASDLGYRLARQFGIPVVPCRPGLVPLTLPAGEFGGLMELTGISFDAKVRSGGAEFEESVLITHRGLSGPAILQISSFWQPGQGIVLNMCPNESLDDCLIQAKRATPSLAPAAFLSTRFPARFVHWLCATHGWSRALGEMPDSQVRSMAGAITHWLIAPSGTEGYAKAEVTLGGVDTGALSPKTMECREVPGLFFVGEVMDVTGWLGGYNFQWAWSSGAAAGRAM